MLSNHEWTGILYLLKRLEPRRSGRGHPIEYPWYLICWLALWAAFHQWPMAELVLQLQREGWPRVLRRHVPRRLRRRVPDVSTLSRRWRAEEFFRMLESCLFRLAVTDATAIVDASVLPVGHYSRDPESQFGGAGSHFKRGYKLVRLLNLHGQAYTVRVISADQSELSVTPALLGDAAQRDLPLRRVLGDKIFDSEPLHQYIDQEFGAVLLAPRYPRGRRPKAGRRRPYGGRYRRRAQRILRSSWGKHWWRQRGMIERSNGWLKQRPHNIYALPAFIRRRVRVVRWALCHEIILSVRKRHRMGNQVA